MDRLRILTLNIWNRQGPWDKRAPLIREGVDELAPDLIGLQEVLEFRNGDTVDNQARFLCDQDQYELLYAPAHLLGEGLWFGNALLSRHPVIESEARALPGHSANVAARAVLYALVDAPCGRIPVFVTHLAWRFHEGAIRLQQLEAITDFIAEKAPLRSKNFPALLMGDMNAEPDSDEIRYLGGRTPLNGNTVYFADCWHWAGDGGPGYTFDRRNPFAGESHEPPRRIDYIFVRGPDRQCRGEPRHTRVVFDGDRDGIFPSDHFGVYTELST